MKDVSDLGFMTSEVSKQIYNPKHFIGPSYIVVTSDEYCRFMNQHAIDFIGRNAYTFMNLHVEP